MKYNKTLINIGRVAIKIFFVYVLVNFILRWLNCAFSNYTLDPFDGALRILPHYYIREGLIPYKDFGVVYPPGLFLLIGKIIPFVSIFQRNLIIALIELVLLVINWILFYKIQPVKRTLLPLAFFIMLETTMLDEVFFSEPFSRTLATILILMLVWALKGKKIPFIFTILVSALVVWFRWNNIALLIVVQIATVAGLSLYNHFKKSQVFPDLRKIWNFIVFEMIGVLLGLSLLLLYLAVSGSFYQGLDFIFNIPALVILEYRSVSLLKHGIDTITFFLSTLFVFVVNLIYVFLWRAKSTLLIILSVTPFFILPYALGRADQFHIWQFYYFVGLSTVIIHAITNKTKFLFFLMIILFLLTCSYFWPQKPQLSISNSLLYSNLSQNLDNCKKSISRVKNYRSLFVGRLSYELFISSTASLYLINPYVKPATSFISDEPGLQNSSKYGSIIAGQLKKAPKPMLAFLEIGKQYPEPNKTQFMKSEGRIKQVLKENQYGVVGVCQAYDRYFVIRLYDVIK